MLCPHGYPKNKCYTCHDIPDELLREYSRMHDPDSIPLREFDSKAERARALAETESLIGMMQSQSNKSYNPRKVPPPPPIRTSPPRKSEKNKPKAIRRNDDASVKKEYKGDAEFGELILVGVVALCLVGGICIGGFTIMEYIDKISHKAPVVEAELEATTE